VNSSLSKSAIFATLPPPPTSEVRPHIRAWVARQPDHKLVVLDDDPTGTQTVADIPVLATWEVATLQRELALPGPCFYVLTNSRSLTSEQAAGRCRAVARNLREAVWRKQGFAAEPPHWRALCSQAFTLVSRGDSTLRGHYPIETDALAEELGPFDATILMPYLEAGGRYTLHDTHYVAEGETLVPAAETPFARDAAFGYHHSNLREYIQEKTCGRIQAGQVVSFSIAELRTAAAHHEPTRQVLLKLLGLQQAGTAIVNACCPMDAERFALATLGAEQAGGRYLFRTAAQFVAARLGQEAQPLWKPARDSLSQAGGLTVVGSHVPKTTEQLLHLIGPQMAAHAQLARVAALEVSVGSLLESAASRDAAIHSVVASTHGLLREGREVVLFTSRQVIAGATAAETLAIAVRVSAALVEIVHRLEVRPRYLVAKGGITSSDLATQGLGMKRAVVRGQILPGVPVWELDQDTKFPGLIYIVFPGNVGGPAALAEVLQKLALPIHL
jgi:uncharacterized protein YgbK (DUF1537 family)